MNRETVIGLEVHVQLATASKIFSGSATTFGAAPNSQADAVDLAMPGTLPVLNENAVRCAVLFGLAIDADISLHSVFERKNYFYPDLPKGYQISQFQSPVVGKGCIAIQLEDGSSREIGITRAHLEEDAGKSLHEDWPDQSGIDLNRAGTALLEIVSEPELRSAAEAVAYLKTIHAIVTYLGISDGNMAEGSMRCDVNLSLRPSGQTALGTRTEIKNVNSFRFVEKAIAGEAQRQRDILQDGGRIVQESRLYDAERNETRPMRSKEVANDYRYFPEPDLLPLAISRDYVQALRESLPELPRRKHQRLQQQYALSGYDAAVLSASRALADYFESVAAHCGDAKLAANWVQGELLAQLKRSELDIAHCPLAASDLGALIERIRDHTISGKIARQVFATLWREGGPVDDIIARQGLRQVSDSAALEAMVNAVIAAHPEQLQHYRDAPADKRKKLHSFFTGKVMQASKGQANPHMVNKLLAARLAAESD